MNNLALSAALLDALLPSVRGGELHQDCRVTIQQIGNTSTDRVRAMRAQGAELQPVWVLDARGEVRLKDLRAKVWSNAKRQP